MTKLLVQGAEARIFRDKNIIIKDRFPKKYRITEIDNKLRGFRTRREAKVLEKLHLINFPSPKIISSDEKETISMESITGSLLKDTLEKEDHKKLGKEIGERIAVLHDNHIIHGDLTTSNMIFNNKIYFIDFGLSFFSHKREDMAVDLHLLKRVLESRHHSISQKCFHSVLEGYKESKNAMHVIARLKQVEQRGRYKHK